MEINNKQLVEMFGTETIKKYYTKNKKVNTINKCIMLNTAKNKYKKVEDLGRGRYIILEPYTKEELIKIEYENTYLKNKGVYKIQKDNNVYIGSTNATFKKRLHGHKHYNTRAYQLLLSGGEFSIIYNATELDTEETIRNKEQAFIDEYLKNGFNLLNVIEKTYVLSQKYKKVKSKTLIIKESANSKIKINKLKKFMKENDIEFFEKTRVEKIEINT